VEQRGIVAMSVVGNPAVRRIRSPASRMRHGAEVEVGMIFVFPRSVAPRAKRSAKGHALSGKSDMIRSSNRSLTVLDHESDGMAPRQSANPPLAGCRKLHRRSQRVHPNCPSCRSVSTILFRREQHCIRTAGRYRHARHDVIRLLAVPGLSLGGTGICGYPKRGKWSVLNPRLFCRGKPLHTRWKISVKLLAFLLVSQQETGR